MGCVIVVFPECREVFVGGVSQGNNLDEDGEYRILPLGDGLQTFQLGGEQNYTPPFQKVVVEADSTAILPQRVVFLRNP